MKTALLISILFIFTFSSAHAVDDWGRNGHRATGEIASKYLSKKAKRNIKKILDGQSLALVSTYGDEIKSDSKFRKYSPWHYVNIPFDSTYEEHPKNKKGDLIVAITKCVEVLKNKNSSKEDQVFYLKLLVHFIGDLHQPLHIGQAKDKGGNDFQVEWFRNGTNLHKVWDSKMIKEYKMSYSELAANEKELSRTEVAQIQEGSILDWMYESRALCKDIYAHTEVGQKLWYPYMYRYMGVVRTQMQKGGIRLAQMLNEIYG